MRRIFTALAVCLLATTLALQTACTRQTAISDILASPVSYEGKEVFIRGTVTSNIWVGAISRGLYQVAENSSSIWVVTEVAPPQQGSTVTVKGKVASAVIIANQSLGTHIVESSRK